MLSPMLSTRTHSLPDGPNWIYEPKYDGFRCIVTWSKDHVCLQSRNGKDLSHSFPEITQWLGENPPSQPVQFDTELVYLTSELRSQFSMVQKRSRLKKTQSIQEYAVQFPCQLMVFDLLILGEQNLVDHPLDYRKKLLTKWFKARKYTERTAYIPLKLIHVYKCLVSLTKQLHYERGEGIVAKHLKSSWDSGIRTKQWLKWKLKQSGTVILTDYAASNGYFTGRVYQDQELLEVVSISHGFSADEKQSLVEIFKQKGTQVSSNHWTLPPGICVQVASLGLYDGKLREPEFSQFSLDTDPLSCTFNQLQHELSFPFEYVDLTHPDKPILPNVRKADYLYYLQVVAPMMLPFLQQRLLTVIRYPHGEHGESFYQKNKPTYAPSYIESVIYEETDYIICNQIDSLLWLGNQLALEFHIPFQKHMEHGPSEIVIDLDPPSADDFQLAVQAAQLAKTVVDYFSLPSFVKTSGGKGLQLYIPLQPNCFSYIETRSFTLFLCEFLTEQHPELFTLERLKKNRKGRLYLDYLQHERDKTIIAPYSVRGKTGYVATPLEWDELTETLRPESFTIERVLERLTQQKDPFREYELSRVKKPFAETLKTIQKQTLME